MSKEVQHACNFIIFLTFFSVFLILSSVSLSLLVLKDISLFYYDCLQTLPLAYTYYLGYKIFYKSMNIKLNFCMSKGMWKDLFLSLFILIFCQSVWIGIMNLFHFSSMESELSWFGIIYFCVLAPIWEEIIFRGYILQSLKNEGKNASLLLSSMLFGIFHLNILQCITGIYVGLITGKLYQKQQSLLPGILLHIMNNTSVIFLNNMDFYILSICSALGGIILLSVLLKMDRL